MWKFTEIADWWSEKQRETSAFLDQWVEESNYNQGVMLVAATTESLTSFGAGFVDLLRLGDGVQEGGLKGWGSDGLRLVGIFPFGKVGQMIARVRGARAASLIVDIAPGKEICAWVASTKALVQIGHKYTGKVFATVEDLAKAAGVEVSTLTGMVREQVHNVLTQVGAKFTPWAKATANIQYRTAKSVAALEPKKITLDSVKKIARLEQAAMAEIQRIVPHDGSIALLGVYATARNGEEVGHLIYAYREVGGTIKFMDRSVDGVKKGVYNSIEEISQRYANGLLEYWTVYEYSILKNVFVRSVGSEAPRLVIPVLGVIASEEKMGK